MIAAPRTSRRMARAACLLALAALTPVAAATTPPQAPREQVIAALSQNKVSITATFSGSEMFVFGAVKRSAPAREGKLDVIVEISGPSEPVEVRRKRRLLGVWVNRDKVRIDAAPSFYAIAATGPLHEILTRTDDLRHSIDIDHKVRMIGAAPVRNPEAFRQALMRLRRQDGLYFESPARIEVIDDTLFTTDVALPANLVEGLYRARVFLLHDRQVTDMFETEIDVRKVGLERWVYTLSRERPLVYGILSVLVALLAGWTASETFRILRR